MTVAPLQRIRIWYRKTEAASDIAPGRLGQVWAAACEAAGMTLARPEGSKRRRIEAGPALPEGATGEREPIDVWLAQPVQPEIVCTRLRDVLPSGLDPVLVEEVGERLPSLAASMRAARYRAVFRDAPIAPEILCQRVRQLMHAAAFPWVEHRGERVREIDLRSYVLDLEGAASGDHGIEVTMRLVLCAERRGRPSSVLAALGIERDPDLLVRTAVEVDQPRIALRAWREVGRFE